MVRRSLCLILRLSFLFDKVGIITFWKWGPAAIEPHALSVASAAVTVNANRRWAHRRLGPSPATTLEAWRE